MPSPYNYVDSTGSFVANIILKNNRNEVQIYHFASSSTSSGSIIDESKTKRHETSHAITCATWFNDSNVVKVLRKAAKRKAENDNATSNNDNDLNVPSSLLAVAFTSGDVRIYSPYSDAPVATIISPATVIALTQSGTESCFWALTDSQIMLEFNAYSGIVNRTFRLSKIDKEIDSLLYTLFKPKKSSHRGPDRELILVASSRLYLVDGAKNKKHLIAEFANAYDDERITPISKLSGLTSDDLSVLVVREKSNTVALYDLDDPTQKPSTWECKSRHITGVRSITENYVAVFTDIGTEILTVKDDALEGCATLISTNYKKIVFSDMLYTEAHGVVGIWYDGNEPRFVKVASEPVFEGNLKVDINYQPVTDDNIQEDAPDITFVIEENEDDLKKTQKLSPSALFALLKDHLLNTNLLRNEILTLCTRNNEEETIKETIRLFSQSEQCAIIVINLFQIISREVSRDPTRKTPLALWLKWILLAHGGFISRQQQQEEPLRALKTSLVQGMEMMPKLLALQGRLQLLKSQADLRSKTSQLALEEEEDAISGFDQDIGNDTTNNTTAFEDLVMYVNGENDDFEADTTLNGSIVYENGEADEIDAEE